MFRGGDDGGDDGDDDGSDAGGGDAGDGEVGGGVDGESRQWCGRALKTGGLRWCTALSKHCALCTVHVQAWEERSRGSWQIAFKWS